MFETDSVWGLVSDIKKKVKEECVMARPRREHGGEQPHIPAGIFKIRIPFYHWKWTWPEAVQGFILVAVALAAVPFIQTGIGASVEVAVLMVFMFSVIYMLHPTFGDPIFPGWITAGIPITLAYLYPFAMGPQRIHALVSLQMLVAFMFIVLGATGIANKIVSLVPASLRGGVLFGAAIAAIFGIINPVATSHFYGREISGTIGVVVCLIVLYGVWFVPLKNKNIFFSLISKSGMLAGMIIALIIGVAIGELPMPEVQWGISPLPFGELFANYTIFGVGFPPASYFIAAIPTAILLYLIAFGEIVVTEAMVTDVAPHRPDEIIGYSANRANIIVGTRNLILSLFAPYPPMAGPNWMGGTASTIERYKTGRKNMDSLNDGISSFIIAMAIAPLFLPLVTLLAPAFPIGMIITMMVTGFAVGYVAMGMLKTREDQGIAIIMGLTIFARGAAVGLVTGVALYFLLVGIKKTQAAMTEKKDAEEKEEEVEEVS